MVCVFADLTAKEEIMAEDAVRVEELDATWVLFENILTKTYKELRKCAF